MGKSTASLSRFGKTVADLSEPTERDGSREDTGAAGKQRFKIMENPTTIDRERETAEKFHNTDEGEISELLTKIEALKSEKLQLSHENEGMEEQVNKLNQKVDHLHAMEEETDEWEDEDSSFLDSIAERSADLEIEVNRLQHDLISSTREVGEAKREVIGLKTGLEEKALVIERLRSEIAEFRKEKVKVEKKGRELETKIRILEIRFKEEKGKKTRVQDEMKERIREFRKKIQYLEDEVAEAGDELRRSKRVRRQCQKKVMGLEEKMLEFKDTVDEKTIEAAMSRKVDIDCQDKGVNVPIVAAGTVAAIVVAAAMGNRCLRKQS
ncbi:peroxisomal and mitochondrial division factor 2-like [Hibiscus syriacus]|uniref:peroxisomal and mitochondrial division factor 2-like n=1 Tax=Hibiscus syriacus TaxID=106335 RepID=UPI0019216DF4|nr:peroxisomal and mitochondrial division factor 2-like [Hibiscus syriacus]